jgi:hypothetical protein
MRARYIMRYLRYLRYEILIMRPRYPKIREAKIP